MIEVSGWWIDGSLNWVVSCLLCVRLSSEIEPLTFRLLLSETTRRSLGSHWSWSSIDLQSLIVPWLWWLTYCWRWSRIDVLSILDHSLLFTQLSHEPGRRVLIVTPSIHMLIFCGKRRSLFKPNLLLLLWSTLLILSHTAERQLLILLELLFEVGFSLNCLLKLKVFVPDLLFLLLNDSREVWAEILITLNVDRFHARNLQHLLFQLLDNVILFRELESQGPDLRWRVN